MGGLIGFPEFESYILIQHRPDSPFYWLQAIDNGELAFVVVDPTVFEPSYNVPISKPILESLKAGSRDELSLFAIVTIPQGKPDEMTANLLGPVVLNTDAKLARQLVLDDRNYSHRSPIFKGNGG